MYGSYIPQTYSPHIRFFPDQSGISTGGNEKIAYAIAGRICKPSVPAGDKDGANALAFVLLRSCYAEHPDAALYIASPGGR